jgi:DNA-directed RNA polymerase subunit RPC12/RpoP
MATKIQAAQERLFHNVFVCKDCGKKVRSDPVRILAGKVRCPRCGKRAFRTIRKK